MKPLFNFTADAPLPGNLTVGAADAVSWRWRALAWVSIYLGLAGLPLALLLIGPSPVARGGGFWWDFAMALGFGGLAIMGLQFALTARFRRATAPFGVDIVYYFHRWAAVGAMVLLVGHYGILRLGYGPALGPGSPLDASWPMTAGRVAFILFATLIVTSLWRRRFHLDYDRWRVGHSVMAVIAVALAIGHIEGIGNYSRATWHGRFWLSYSVFWLLLVAYIRIGKPLALRRRPYRVLSVIPEAGAAWTLVLEPQVQPALAFRPGQFAWLTLGQNPFGAKEHPFSFSGSATDRRTLRFTIKELGDFTRTIGRTRVGEIAYVDGPYGVFTTDLHAAAPGFVFIAGGVGIAPIVSILRTLADRGDRRPLVLIYGNWRWDATLFREELEALQQRLPLRIVHVLQEPPVPWTGESGYITEAILRRSLRPVEGHTCTFFLCGPKPMMDFVRPSLHRMKIPLCRIHFEFFEMA